MGANRITSALLRFTLSAVVEAARYVGTSCCLSVTNFDHRRGCRCCEGNFSSKRPCLRMQKVHEVLSVTFREWVGLKCNQRAIKSNSASEFLVSFPRLTEKMSEDRRYVAKCSLLGCRCTFMCQSLKSRAFVKRVGC